MTGKGEPKPWHRVAEAGFGACVESHGFRRVGKAHWRLDGPEVSWRLALVKGYDFTPGSFCAMYGGLVHCLDELCQKVDGKPASDRMRGMSAHGHIIEELGDTVFATRRRMYRDSTQSGPEAETFRGWMKFLFLRGDKPVHSRKEYERISKVPHWGEIGSTLSATGFHFDDGSVEDVAQAMIGYFEDYALPLIGDHATLEKVYRRIWGPGALHLRQDMWKERFAAAVLMQDQTYMQEMVDSIFVPSQLTEAETWTELKANGAFDSQTHKNGRMSDEALVVATIRNRLTRAKIISDIVENMGVPVTVPAIDFTKIDLLWQRADELESD